VVRGTSSVREVVFFLVDISYKVRELQLTLNLLTYTIVAPHSNASKWQMGFNSAFKGLICHILKNLSSFENDIATWILPSRTIFRHICKIAKCDY
jgi:hypothetical protein